MLVGIKNLKPSFKNCMKSNDHFLVVDWVINLFSSLLPGVLSKIKVGVD